MNLDKISKFFVLATLLFAGLLLPVHPVGATTMGALEAKVSELQSQVNNLKNQVAALSASRGRSVAQVSSVPAQWGDLNGDGQVTLADVVSLSLYLQGSTTFTDTQKALSDLDQSGSLDKTDLYILSNVVLGKVLPGWLPIRFGDLNMDGSVTLADQVLESRIATGATVLGTDEKGMYEKFVGDLNLDQKINSNDVQLLQKFLLGTISSLPVPANPIKVQSAPALSSINPTSGTVGTKVTLKGSGFSRDTNMIDLETSGGAVYSHIMARSQDGRTLVFSVPSTVNKCGEMYPDGGCISMPTPSGHYQVAVTNTNGKTSGLLYIDITVTLQGTIQVNVPNGGETFHPGDTVSISWTTQQVAAGSRININLVDPVYSNSLLLIAGDLDAANQGGTYQWTIPSTVALGHYEIRINCSKENPDPGSRSCQDTSDSPFGILSTTAPTPVTSTTTTPPH